jgi:hypothetical protein
MNITEIREINSKHYWINPTITRWSLKKDNIKASQMTPKILVMGESGQEVTPADQT